MPYWSVVWVFDVKRFLVCLCFLLQAEDVIRDLVRFRGVGDVYKRQVQASTDLPVRRTASVHYQGMVRGEPGSIAAISVFPDQVMGLLADADGQRVIGRLDNDRDGLHVFYREQDLRGSPGAQCDVREVPGDASHPVPAAPGERTTRCVRFYWEVDNDIFVNKGSVTNATNYVTGLFNQSSIIYANDGIDVALSEVYVWDVTSPYTSNSSGELLDQFGDYRTSFNGDLAHLLAFRGGGGIAWLNTLCNGTRYRCLLYTSPSPRDRTRSRMPSSA